MEAYNEPTPQEENSSNENEIEKILISVEPMYDARSRELLEGVKAQASDTHGWDNRLQL
jgi:hypothetical protein